jgi:hypothetical protein
MHMNYGSNQLLVSNFSKHIYMRPYEGFTSTFLRMTASMYSSRVDVVGNGLILLLEFIYI